MKALFLYFLVLMFFCLGNPAGAQKPKILNAKARNSVKEFDKSILKLVKQYELQMAKLKEKQAKVVDKDRMTFAASLQTTVEADLKNGKTESAIATSKVIDHFKKQETAVEKSTKTKRKKRNTVDIPKDAIKANGHHYLLVKKTASRNVAQKHAESLGGHLVRIESETELAFIHQAIKKTKGLNGPCLIDGNDEAVEGQWVWSNGQPISYFKWGPKQPSNGGEGPSPQNGLTIWKRTGKMHDAQFDLRRYYVIEWDQ